MPPREIEQLTQVNVELIQAIRQLIEQERQAGVRSLAQDQRIGVGPMGNVNVGAGLPDSYLDQVGKSTSFWDQQAGASMLNGAASAGNSASQQFIRGASSSFGAIPGALGGVGAAAMTGNPAAIGASVGNLAAEATKSALAPAFAAADVFRDAPTESDPFLDQSFIAKRTKLEARVAFSTANQKSSLNRSLIYAGAGFDGLQQYDAMMSQQIRGQRADFQALNSTQKGLESRLNSFFAPLSAGGKAPSRQHMEQMGEFFLHQAEADFETRKMAQEVSSAIIMKSGHSKPAR